MVSKSKIPPEIAGSLVQVGQLVCHRVQTFRFHVHVLPSIPVAHCGEVRAPRSDLREKYAILAAGVLPVLQHELQGARAVVLVYIESEHGLDRIG